MAGSSSVFLRRRLVAIGVVLAVVLGVAAAAGAFSGEEPEPGERRSSSSAQEPAAAPPELPRGGRAIFPKHRVVGFYGAPQARALGVLGIGSPDTAARKLIRQAKPYQRRRRPVLPALELITVIANADAGEDGKYRSRQANKVIRRYLRAARRHKMLLVLDVQPGQSDFFTETSRLERWLREPDVGLAIDPEWRMQPGQVPGTVIGSVAPREVNATSAWLAQLVQKHNLPQKLFIVHQFTDDMVDDKRLKRRSELAMVLNADGFGTPAAKISKYKAFTRASSYFQQGFKLFYEEDVGLMSPRRVMRLRPQPDVVMYE